MGMERRQERAGEIVEAALMGNKKATIEIVPEGEIVKELIAGGFSEYRGVVNSDAKYRWGKSWGHSDGKVAVWTSSGRCFIAKDTEENRKRAEELARKMGGSGNANVPASLE